MDRDLQTQCLVKSSHCIGSIKDQESPCTLEWIRKAQSDVSLRAHIAFVMDPESLVTVFGMD
eukprot:1144964-Pelagomonas_calceolata.AAC.6